MFEDFTFIVLIIPHWDKCNFFFYLKENQIRQNQSFYLTIAPWTINTIIKAESFMRNQKFQPLASRDTTNMNWKRETANFFGNLLNYQRH